MRAQRLAHALGAERAPAERDHARAAGERLEHDLLLALAERGLTLAGPEHVDRLAERGGELRVGVPQRDAEQARGLAGARRLAGSHEAGEDEAAI